MDTKRVAPTRGSTAISYAIGHHTTEKVRLLLATGVDVNVANVDGGFAPTGPVWHNPPNLTTNAQTGRLAVDTALE